MKKALFISVAALTLTISVAGPSRATAHPLLTDPQGDVVLFGCQGIQCPNKYDPAWDILTADVSATQLAVTVTVGVVDFAPTGNDVIKDGYTTFLRYGGAEGAEIELRELRDRLTGSVTVRGFYRDVNGRFARIDGLTASTDPVTHTLTIRAPFSAFDAAIAPVHGVPIAHGTSVDVSSEAHGWYGAEDTPSVGFGTDSTDVYSGYRLGS